MPPAEHDIRAADGAAIAQITALPAEHAGLALAPPILKKAILWALGPLFVCILATLLLLACIAAAELQPVLAPVIIVPLVIIGLCIYRLLTDLTGPADRCIRQTLYAALKERPDIIVDPDSPQAVFVEVVPRENWRRFRLETATDVGFLRVDLDRREILFEGDAERYRIPGAAVIACQIEESLPALGTRFWEGFYMQWVVLRVLCDGGVKEIPFGVRAGYGPFNLGARRTRARELCSELRSITALKAEEEAGEEQ